MEKTKMKKSIISMLLIFAVLAFLVSCGGSEGSGNGGIYGVVNDYDTGEPIANVKVELDQQGYTTGSHQAALTGSDGMFEFRYLESGLYLLTVSKAGYTDTIDYIQPTNYIEVHNSMVRFDVQMRRR
jgi:hypothetical protein